MHCVARLHLSSLCLCLTCGCGAPHTPQCVSFQKAKCIQRVTPSSYPNINFDNIGSGPMANLCEAVEKVPCRSTDR